MSIQLSIITPVFNGGRWIERSIRSVIDQNCPEVEHVIVDGCSRDNTCQIIKRYADQHPHIRWVSEKDLGQVEAMNKGLRIARGNIIGFLNADDFYEPGVFNRVLKLFQDPPKPMFLVGNLYMWEAFSQERTLFKSRKLTFNALLLGPRINKHPLNPSCYFYDKSIHDRVGLYNPNFSYNMDLDFIIRAARAVHIQYVDEVWGNYWQHAESKTHHSITCGIMEGEDEKVILHNIKQVSGWKRCWYLWRYRVTNFLNVFLNFLRKLKRIILGRTTSFKSTG